MPNDVLETIVEQLPELACTMAGVYMGLRDWKRGFRRAAKADQHCLLRKHLVRLGLPDEPEAFREATITVVSACLPPRKWSAEYLARQAYDPTDARDARYTITFHLGGGGFACARMSTLTRPGIDLAELLEFPWPEHHAYGYQCLWVTRTDGRQMTPADISAVKKDISADLRYDYAESELSIDFDAASLPSVLKIDVSL